MLSRLDYCNAVLAGLPLQRAQNAAVRLVARLGASDLVTMSALLCVIYIGCLYNYRITYKLCLLCILSTITIERRPHLAESVIATAKLNGRTRLWSASSLRYEQPMTWLRPGERCSFAGTPTWNSLPPSVQEPSDSECFKRHHKTVLFQRCFGSIVWRFN